MEALPVLEASEVMYVMFSTPLMASSRGTITLFCTAVALAPLYVVLTRMVGGAISGYCSTGSTESPMTPTITMNMDITSDRIGLSMNVLRFIFLILLLL